MLERDLGRTIRSSFVIIIVAVCLLIAGVVYALVAAFSGTPLADDSTYTGKYGPDISVMPGLYPGDAPTSGHLILPYSILHLWVNATGPCSVVVTDPARYVIHEADTPVNLSYFAAMGGYYEVTFMPKASNVTVTLTITSERLPTPASQSELNSLRGGLMVSLAIIAAALSVTILLIVILLLDLERRVKRE